MGKRLSLFLCIFLLLAQLVACENGSNSTNTILNTSAPPDASQNNSFQPNITQPSDGVSKDYYMPTVDEDYWELLCENCDIIVYLDTTRENFLMFLLVSAQDLDGKSMKVTTDSDVTAEVEILKEWDAETFPFHTFMMYQGVEWETVDKSLGSWKNIYMEVLEVLPKLHTYKIYIPLDWLGIVPDATVLQRIETFTVTVEGQSKDYDLGNVCFLPGGIDANTSSEGGLRATKTVLRSGYSEEPSQEGTLQMLDWSFVAKQDVVLQGISVCGHDEIAITSCDVVVTTPSGDRFNMRWDAKSPLELDEGSKISIDLVLADPALASTLISNVVRYLSLDYTKNGEIYSSVLYISCHILPNAHDIYAQKVDGMDILPYYLRYNNYEG